MNHAENFDRAVRSVTAYLAGYVRQDSLALLQDESVPNTGIVVFKKEGPGRIAIFTEAPESPLAREATILSAAAGATRLWLGLNDAGRVAQFWTKAPADEACAGLKLAEYVCMPVISEGQRVGTVDNPAAAAPAVVIRTWQERMGPRTELDAGVHARLAASHMEAEIADLRAALAAPLAQAAQRPVGEVVVEMIDRSPFYEYRPLARLEAGIHTLYAKPSVAAAPARDPEQLLEVSRHTGLRHHLHGVSATHARELLAKFVAELDTRSATPAAPVAPSAQAKGGDGLNAALMRAATELPDLYMIRVEVERGAGWVQWYDDEGNEFVIDSEESSLAEDVEDALQAALYRAAAAANPEPSGGLGAAHDAEGGGGHEPQ